MVSCTHPVSSSAYSASCTVPIPASNAIVIVWGDADDAGRGPLNSSFTLFRSNTVWVVIAAVTLVVQARNRRSNSAQHAESTSP